jgi:hypothetical protein
MGESLTHCITHSGNFHYNENCNGCFVDPNAPVPNVLTCYCRQNDPTRGRLENSIDPCELYPSSIFCFGAFKVKRGIFDENSRSSADLA